MAHVALRADLLAEARRHAEAYVASRPEDAVGRETLFQVLAREGQTDADHLLEPPR
jgi:protein involved in temperature-dependent protein secretion